MTTSSVSPRRSKPLTFVLLGGFVAGAFDITYACTFWALKAGLPPTRIFQSVAAGLLGAASFTGGAATAALGLGLHFFIATSMSATYYLVSGRFPELWQHPLRYGPAYGLLLYGIMNYIVLPLSAVTSGGAKYPIWIALSIMVHVCLIGTPIALFTKRARQAGGA